MSKSGLPVLSSEFYSFRHYILVFNLVCVCVCGIRKYSNFILLHVAVQFPQHLLKSLSFLHCISLPSLLKIRCPYMCGFISGLYFSIDLSFFFAPTLYYFVDCSFVVQSETRKFDSSSSIFLSQDFLTIWHLLSFYANFEMFCSTSVKNSIGNLIESALNLQIALGSIVFFTVVMLPLKNIMYLSICLSSLISFISVLQFCV